MLKRPLLIAGFLLAIGGVVALVTAFATSHSNLATARTGLAPIPFDQASFPQYMRTSLAKAAATAGLETSSLSVASSATGEATPGLVYGSTQTGAMNWAIETPHMHTSFLDAADALTNAPVYIGVGTFGGSSGSIVSDVVGVFRTQNVVSIRLTESDGSVKDLPTTAWPGTGYASFAFTTSQGVSPTLVEATNEAGNVVYRKVINVDGHCFDTGTVC